MLPAVALILSLVSIALTMWFRYSDGVRLASAVNFTYPMDGIPLRGSERVQIQITNRSRNTATSVETVALALEGDRTLARMDLGPGDAQLPARLEPGQSLTVSYPAYNVGIALEEIRAPWVRVRAKHGHGLFLGKRDRALAQKLKSGVQTYRP
ncbi:hypothetical protein GCM10009670_04240 [Citricoccus alkalitolerans]